MRLTMIEKKTLIKVFNENYICAPKGIRSKILDEFIKLSGFNRNYAARLLRSYNPVITKKKKTRKRHRYYDKDVQKALEIIWPICDYICGKRLVGILPEMIDKLILCGELNISKETYDKLKTIKPTTIDTLLKRAKSSRIYKRTYSNPGKFLIDNIPIKTFGEWKNTPVGFTQIDLVAHNGGDPFGAYFHTLNLTDVSSGWTVCALLKSKTKIQVLKGLFAIKKSLPFKLKGIHSDNGSEFINQLIIDFCKKYEIFFTRGRPYKKNDSCYIEQKNFSMIRRNVGYLRYYTEVHGSILKLLYEKLNLYYNFFLPTMSLLSKTRVGSKVYRKYDKPMTPYQRIKKNSDIPKSVLNQLHENYILLNPAELREQINMLQNKLIAKSNYIKKSKIKEEDRIRRRKTVTHTIPEKRRNNNKSKAPNPFLEKYQLERLRAEMQPLWDLRDKLNKSNKN